VIFVHLFIVFLLRLLYGFSFREKVAKSKVCVSISGQLSSIAALFLMSISSMVQPVSECRGLSANHAA